MNKQNYWNFELYEYTGAVGSTTFHITAKDKIKRLNNEFEITIKQSGVYIQDGHEFIEGDPF